MGVGDNDVAGDSVKSYLSSMRQIAKHSGFDITSTTLRNSSDIEKFANQISKNGEVSEKTIKNYISAMKQYVAMVSIYNFKT